MFEDSQAVAPSMEFPALAAAIDALPSATPGGDALASGARVRALLTLHRQLGQRLLAELACFDSQGFGAGYGFPSTASWLRRVASLDHHHAAAMVGSARTAAALPQLQAELAAGRIGVEHVEALNRTTRRVPVDEVARHDETLVSLAGTATPSDLATAGKAIAATWRHDLADRDAARLREIRRFDFSPTIEGLWHVDGLLPVEVGAQLATLVEPLARPRGQEDERTATQRRADAFAELLDTALRHAPLPDVAGERPRLTLLVTADPAARHPGAPGVGSARPDPGGWEAAGGATGEGEGESDGDAEGPEALVGDMLGQRGLHRALIADGSVLAAFKAGSAANLIGSRSDLSPQTLARLACEAEVALAIVDRGGDVLNLGRTSRFPNLAERRALVVRDRGCVFPGCDRPPAACIAHHLVWWSRGGRTDLDNLALVCHFHHHLIHEDGWTLERLEPSEQAAFGGWRATSPRGLELTQFRQPAA